MSISCSVMLNSLRHHGLQPGLLGPWDFPGKNIEKITYPCVNYEFSCNFSRQLHKLRVKWMKSHF